MKKNIFIKIVLYCITILIFILSFNHFKQYKNPEPKIENCIFFNDIRSFLLNKDNSINHIVRDNLKKSEISGIVFKKSTLRDYIKQGQITVFKGSEISDIFRVQGIANSYIWMQLKKKRINPNHTFIFLSEENLYANIYPILLKKIHTTQIKTFEDSKFKYDGDISYNYIIEISLPKNEILDIPLSYNEKAIINIKNNNFNIILNNPADEDIYETFDFKLFVLIDDNRPVNDYFNFNSKSVNIIADDFNYFQYQNNNKYKYRRINATTNIPKIIHSIKFKQVKLLFYNFKSNNFRTLLNNIQKKTESLKKSGIRFSNNIINDKIIVENISLKIELSIFYILILFYILRIAFYTNKNLFIIILTINIIYIFFIIFNREIYITKNNILFCCIFYVCVQYFFISIINYLGNKNRITLLFLLLDLIFLSPIIFITAIFSLENNIYIYEHKIFYKPFIINFYFIIISSMYYMYRITIQLKSKLIREIVILTIIIIIFIFCGNKINKTSVYLRKSLTQIASVIVLR